MRLIISMLFALMFAGTAMAAEDNDCDSLIWVAQQYSEVQSGCVKKGHEPIYYVADGAWYGLTIWEKKKAGDWFYYEYGCRCGTYPKNIHIFSNYSGRKIARYRTKDGELK